MRRALFLLLGVACAGFAAEEWQLSWEELGPIIAGKKVELVLPDATTVRGPVLAVDADALRMVVRRTSNRRAYPKGVSSIPRSSVSVLRLIRRGSRWQIIGTVAGTFAGLVAGGVVAYYSGSDAAGYAVWGGTAAAGYGLGYAGDKKTTLILVLPEASESALQP